MTPLITFLTDFGLQDGYVAAMKAVLLGTVPQARFVDISHLIPPQDIRWGAYVLKSCYADFPAGTIHVAVVDPGVGTDRKCIAVRTDRYFFVGPDNGLFSFVLEEEPRAETRLLANQSLFRPTISPTFHGRDIFAPVAAHFATGTPFTSIGPKVDPVICSWVRPLLSPTLLEGEVLGSDRFGNIVTNIQARHLAEWLKEKIFEVYLEERKIPAFAKTYGDVPLGRSLALLGSSNHLEIAVHQGSAAKRYGAQAGQKVRVVIVK
ncbi:MAG: SAM-dependent chlorinase/fluorinase [Desulfosoma sp.]